MHYALSTTARAGKCVRTACERRVIKTRPNWTTAAAVVRCPECLATDAWLIRAGRFGVGEPEVAAELEVEPLLSRFAQGGPARGLRSRDYREYVDGPVPLVQSMKGSSNG